MSQRLPYAPWERSSAKAMMIRLATFYVLFKAALAIGIWGVVFTGFLQAKLTWWERILGLAAGASLILATPISDEIGFALSAIFIAQHDERATGAEAATA